MRAFDPWAQLSAKPLNGPSSGDNARLGAASDHGRAGPNQWCADCCGVGDGRGRQQIADGIGSTEGMDLLLGPQLSVILFRATIRTAEDMQHWAETHRSNGALLCQPTTWHGKKVFRLCIVIPTADSLYMLDDLRTMT